MRPREGGASVVLRSAGFRGHLMRPEAPAFAGVPVSPSPEAPAFAGEWFELSQVNCVLSEAPILPGGTRSW